MQITRISLNIQAGPSDWFTGSVCIDTVGTPSGASRLSASSVHFTPGARTAWHTHPNGRTIYVLEGVGLCHVRGGPVEMIRPGDRVFFEPGEEHWHGAAATRFMTTSPCSRSTTTATQRTEATTSATRNTRRRQRWTELTLDGTRREHQFTSRRRLFRTRGSTGFVRRSRIRRMPDVASARASKLGSFPHPARIRHLRVSPCYRAAASRYVAVSRHAA